MSLELTQKQPARQPILSMESVNMDFALGGLFFKRTMLRALSEISLELYPGRVLALVGESGSGKSTCARMMARVYAPSGGRVAFKGFDVEELSSADLRKYRAAVQMIFQDPFGSLNPTQTVGYHIERALRIHRPKMTKLALAELIVDLLEQVGLVPGESFAVRRPDELSGGQRQRVAIARALSVEPQVLLADEPTSMLDVSVRLGILNLLDEQKQKRNLATLYITHDIATARYLADDVAVLYAGHLVERGSSVGITDHPLHPYTQLLMASVPNPGRRIGMSGTRHATDIPLWTPEKKGCPFAARCPRVSKICGEVMPDVVEAEENRFVRCHNL